MPKVRALIEQDFRNAFTKSEDALSSRRRDDRSGIQLGEPRASLQMYLEEIYTVTGS